MSLKKIKRLLTFTRQGIVDYDQFYESVLGDETLNFSSENTSIFLMRVSQGCRCLDTETRLS